MYTNTLLLPGLLRCLLRGLFVSFSLLLRRNRIQFVLLSLRNSRFLRSFFVDLPLFLRRDTVELLLFLLRNPCFLSRSLFVDTSNLSETKINQAPEMH